MRASILALDDLSPRDIEGWRTLAAEAAEPNPFFEPEYVLPAAELIGGRRMALLVVRAAAGWAACLPIHRPRRWHRVPARGIATWQHRYCFLGTPLVHADGIESAVGALTRELMRQRTAAFVGFDSLCDEGSVREALRASVEAEGGEELRVDMHERAALRRRAISQGYAALKAKHRHELARKRRRLEEALGGTLETLDRAQECEAVDEFLELEASGWKGRGGTALASVELDAASSARCADPFGGSGASTCSRSKRMASGSRWPATCALGRASSASRSPSTSAGDATLPALS